MFGGEKNDPAGHAGGVVSKEPSGQLVCNLESNRKLNPNLDDCFPVQSWRKFENARNLEGRLVQLLVR